MDGGTAPSGVAVVSVSSGQAPSREGSFVNNIFWIIGVVVVVAIVLAFLGLT